MAGKPIYEIYAELDGVEPKIWRKFQVISDMTMSRLAYAIMTLFEMEAKHSYKFDVDEFKNYENGLKVTGQKGNEYDAMVKKCQPIAQYGCILEDEEFEEKEGYGKLENAKDARMRLILKNKGDEVDFYYDFKNGWHIKLRVENKFESDNVKKTELPRVINGQGFGIIEDSKKIEESKNLDIWDMNYRLKEIPLIYKKFYEQKIQPSQEEIKLIKRDYEKVEPKDITIDVEGYRLNARAACIIKHENKVLFHKNINSDHYALIGGRIKLGENSEETVKREIMEELGKEIEIKGYISTVENFFETEEFKYHEYLFIYEAEFKEKDDRKTLETLKNKEGKDYLRYEWIDIDKMDEYPIKPAIIKEILKEEKYPVHKIQLNKV